MLGGKELCYSRGPWTGRCGRKLAPGGTIGIPTEQITGMGIVLGLGIPASDRSRSKLPDFEREVVSPGFWSPSDRLRRLFWRLSNRRTSNKGSARKVNKPLHSPRLVEIDLPALGGSPGSEASAHLMIAGPAGPAIPEPSLSALERWDLHGRDTAGGHTIPPNAQGDEARFHTNGEPSRHGTRSAVIPM